MQACAFQCAQYAGTHLLYRNLKYVYMCEIVCVCACASVERYLHESSHVGHSVGTYIHGHVNGHASVRIPVGV